MSTSRRFFAVLVSLMLGINQAFGSDPLFDLCRSRTEESFDHADIDQWQRIIRAQEEESSPYDEPIATDRPDFTEASSVVGRRVLQLETGYTYFTDDADGTRTQTHSFPETLFRFGITDNIELRLVWNYAWSTATTGGVSQADDGAEDLVMGAKFALTQQNGWIPESALILDFSSPTGGAAVTNQHVEFGSNYLWGYDLPNDKSLAGSFGYSTGTQFTTLLPPAVPLVATDRFGVFHSSVTHGVPVIEKMNAYFEYFGFYFDGLDGGRPEHYFDSGITYLITNDIQFDVRYGIGLNAAANNFFAGTGLSVRF